VSDFRCAVASLARDEPLAGTASTVRAFLLVEHPGPWGVDVLRDARMDPEVRAGLRERASRAGVRVLLVRRHAGSSSAGPRRVFAAYADPERPWLETTTVATQEALLDLDLEALGRGQSLGLSRTTEPVFCVCTHGRHDACCAELGRPTAAALSRSHPEHTWEVSHMGGDRFAANVLVLPDGLYYGRVSAAAAAGVATGHLEGHLDVELLRGRSGHPFAVQVAEVAVRRETGEFRTRAVRLVSARVDDGAAETRFDVDGTAYDVRVRRSQREPHRLTCRASRDSPAPVWDVVSVSPVSAGARASAPGSPPARRG
jgi:hypothetical protein